MFSHKIAELLPRSASVIVDLSSIEMIDSAGLGELVLVLLWSRACGRSIKLASPRPNVMETLRLTNLVSVLEVHPTLQDAAIACRQVRPN